MAVHWSDLPGQRVFFFFLFKESRYDIGWRTGKPIPQIQKQLSSKIPDITSNQIQLKEHTKTS